MGRNSIKMNAKLEAGIEHNPGEVLSDNARRWRDLQKHLETSPVREVTFNSPATIDRWAINFKNENGELETAWVDQPLVAGKNYSMDDLLTIAMKYTAGEQYNIWVSGYRDNGNESKAYKANEDPIEAKSFNEAVQIYVNGLSPEDRKWWRRSDAGHWSMWACRAYPDEASARRFLG